MMRPLDTFLFLVGNRGAIERIAAARRAWVVGALLVLSAGVARNYDHLDLLREPEWFIGPFAASMVSVGFIFLWLMRPLGLAKPAEMEPFPRSRQFGTFLVLTWMTAPCAWIYGVPVEAMTDIVTATKWNIAFLSLVALWRVAIIVRAVSVLAEVSWLRVLPLVLAPAALEAMVGSCFKGLSLVGIMGGVRLPPHTELLRDAANFTAAASFWVFLAAVVATFFVKGTAVKPLHRAPVPLSRQTTAFAAGALVVWLLIALPLQPKLAARHRLQSLIDQEKFEEAVAFAQAKEREDFPRIHHLPPGAEHFDLRVLDLEDAPQWLRQEWSADAREWLTSSWMALNQENLRRVRAHHPELADAVRLHAETLRNEEEISRDDQIWLRRYDMAETSLSRDD